MDLPLDFVRMDHPSEAAHISGIVVYSKRKIVSWNRAQTPEKER
jgi:hypothetical protein